MWGGSRCYPRVKFTRHLKEFVKIQCFLGRVKGQLISKCIFGVFNLSKNERKQVTWSTIVVEFFCSFFGKIEDIKKFLKINWPLTFLPWQGYYCPNSAFCNHTIWPFFQISKEEIHHFQSKSILFQLCFSKKRYWHAVFLIC